MIALSNLGASVQSFTQLGGCADFPCYFIWSRVFGLMRFIYGPEKGTKSSFEQVPEKYATGTQAMIRQAFGEESMSRPRKIQTHQDRRKARQ
jgi:hypothetical protein